MMPGMHEHARTCEVCGDASAEPALEAASATATYDQHTGRLLMPYRCARGHRFVARIETEDFAPAG